MKYLIYLCWIFVYARSLAMRRVLKEISRTQRVFLLLLVALLVSGQLYEKKYPTYPFVKWGMYSDLDHKGTVYSFNGVRPDGSEFRLPMTRVVRTHSKRFVWRLRSLVKEMDDAPNEAALKALESLYDRSLQAAWRLYRKRHPEIELASIRVYALRVNVRRFDGADRIPRKLFREVPL